MMLLEYLMIGIRMFGIPVIAAVIGWFIAFWIKKWFSQKCRWGHKPKYLKIEYFTNFKCDDHFEKHTDDEPLWAALATWVCQEPGCNGHGKRCFGSKAWWTIEHGQMIVDEKKMTDPGKYQTPKEAVEIRKKREAEGREAPIGEAIMKQLKEMELRVIGKIEDKLDRDRKDEKTS